MSDVRVCVIELPARFGEPALQLKSVERALSQAPQADLVLLPEASLTGYVSSRGDFDLSRFAEPLEGTTARTLAALAKEYDTALVGPLIEREGERCFNALVGFDASGRRVLHYRKRHPWFPETWATPGEATLPVVELAGLRVTCAICFDVHFLAQESAAQLLEADLLLFASAWVDDDDTDARTPMLRTLAKQHGVAIANANWGPGAPVLRGQGQSVLISAQGEVRARAPKNRWADAPFARRTNTSP